MEVGHKEGGFVGPEHSVPELLEYGNKILTQLVQTVDTSTIPHFKDNFRPKIFFHIFARSADPMTS